MKKIRLLIFPFLSGISLFAQTATVPRDSATTGLKDENGKEIKQVMPAFPWPSGFNKYLQDSIRYPAEEKEKGIEGTVYISFLVDTDGTIKDIRVEREVPGAPGLTQEALRVIQAMPPWLPSTLMGKPLPMTITQPIRFVLASDKKKKR